MHEFVWAATNLIAALILPPGVFIILIAIGLAAGLKVVPAPIYFHASPPLNVTDFLPSTDGLELSATVLREYVGMLWYGLRREVAGAG
jgi:hypothetical protein